MRTVYKYPINPNDRGYDEVMMHGRDAKVVLVGFQDTTNSTCIWAEVDSDKELRPHYFFVAATGYSEIPDGYEHVGSFLTMKGMFVWHLYEMRI